MTRTFILISRGASGEEVAFSMELHPSNKPAMAAAK